MEDNNLNKWKWWGTIIIPILVASIPLIYKELKSQKNELPKFTIVNPVIENKDTSIIIEAENEAASKEEPLMIEINGIKIIESADLVNLNNPLKWKMKISDRMLKNEVLQIGKNKIRIGFKGGLLSEEYIIQVNKKITALTECDVKVKNGLYKCLEFSEEGKTCIRCEKKKRPPSPPNRNGNYQEIELDDRLVDENGKGLEGVEVWCKNCFSKEKVLSDENGNFSLHRKFKINDEVNYQLVICFRYKRQEDCKTSQFKYINQIELPKFNEK